MAVLLVAYDIPNNRRRHKVYKALTRLGRRVQYSVFIVQRETAESLAEMLRPLLHDREDDVRIHVICAACEHRTIRLGCARLEAVPGRYRVI